MEDRTYDIRMHFNHGNAINLDLKGCGTLYIKPGKDYYFINAPINFINYLAQLKRVGVSYEISKDKRGCYQEIDLRFYNVNDPRYLATLLRSGNQKVVKEEKVKEPPHVVLSSDEGLTIYKGDVSTTIEKDLTVAPPTIPPIAIEEQPTTPPNEEVPTSDKKDEVSESKKPIVYTEEELTKFSKTKLLEIANDLGITSVSDINIKKEIREAILAAQNK